VAFADRLKEARARRVLSQSELAERSNVARITIARAELGQVVPHQRTIRKLAEALGVDPADLVTAEDMARKSKRAA
jgi:transcriptional regulator with XRE-family HTH domain